jgi:Tol biopolymer transport system component
MARTEIQPDVVQPRAAATPGATDAPVPERRSAVVDRHDVASGLAAAASPTTGQLLDHVATPLLARTLLTDAFSPSFAADGEVVFHLGRTDGRVMKASFARNGAVSVTPLVDDAAANYHGALSPDETKLAFDSDRDGIRGIYVAAGDGSSPRRVSGDRFATTPSWSPDGQRLAFVRAEPGHPRVWNVWIADLRTGRLTRVSHHRVGQAWRPSWFPDGQRLVYSVEDDLVVADLARQTSRSIRSPEPGRLVRTPAVSPDGRRVVFQVRGDGVWLFDVASGLMRRVLADPTAEEFAWSPDGTRIAFHAQRVGHWSLWQLSL